MWIVAKFCFTVTTRNKTQIIVNAITVSSGGNIPEHGLWNILQVIQGGDGFISKLLYYQKKPTKWYSEVILLWSYHYTWLDIIYYKHKIIYNVNIQFLTTRSDHTKTILKEGLVVESSSYTYNLFMPIFWSQIRIMKLDLSKYWSLFHILPWLLTWWTLNSGITAYCPILISYIIQY